MYDMGAGILSRRNAPGPKGENILLFLAWVPTTCCQKYLINFFWWRHHFVDAIVFAVIFFFLRRQERELNFPRFGRMGLGSRVYLIICPDLVGVQWQVARIYLRERRIKVRDINSVQRSVLLIHIIILDQGLRILVGSVMYRLGGHSYKFRLRLI